MIRRTPNGGSYAFSTLILEEKEIDWLGDDLGNHKHLLNISLAKNALPNVDCVSQMSGLLQMNASENKIASMAFMADAMCLSHLQNLNLSKNEIRVLSAISQPRLQKLNLDSNKIASLEEFEGKDAASLKILILSNNRLTSLQGLKEMPALKELYLAGN